jgi:aminopeptidase N
LACFKTFDDARLAGLALAPVGAAMPFAEPGVQPHYGPSWTVRILDAYVLLRLDPVGRTFQGRARFDVLSLPTWDGTARFDLAEVEVLAVTDGHGAPLPFVLQDEAIVVTAGDARVIQFAWQGSNPRAGLYFTGPTAAHPSRAHTAWTQFQDEDAHFAVPCLDHPRVKHPWTLEIEGPEGHTLLSNGKLLSSGTRDGHAFAVWRQAEPIPAYLVTVVSAPLHVTESSWRGRPVRYLVPPGSEDRVERSMGRTPEMMEVFSQFTGVDYPWSRYDQVVVHDFIFGGMENVACTTMTDALLVDDRMVPHWDPEGLVCHELAHQWFGDLVTCQDWSQAWLNESWATFMECVWAEHRHGADEGALASFDHASQYLHEDSARYRRPIASYLFREPIDVFDRHLYEKGAVVLRTLRAELGDIAFKAGITHYLNKYSNGTVHGRDFQRAMEDATGRNLDRFFAQWILGAGHPKLDVTLGEEPGLVTVHVKQSQSGAETAEVFHFGLRVELVLADGATKAITLPIRERDRTWAVPVDGAVKTVRVDPGFDVLAEIDLSGPNAWLVALSKDTSSVLALRAVQALARKNVPATVAAVVDALTVHPGWAVRAEAASALGERGGDAARDVLLARLKVEQEPRVLVAIAKSLGRYREAGVFDALVAALQAGTPTWYVTGELLEASGRTRDARALGVIRPYLDVDSCSEVVRQRAAAGLAHTEDAGALDALLAAARSGLDDRALAGVARALGSLGDKVESARKGAREQLVHMLESGGFRTKLGALDGLARLKDTGAIGALEQVHESAPDGRIRRGAYEALYAIRAGRTTDDGLRALRERLEGLASAQTELRARIERVEK